MTSRDPVRRGAKRARGTRNAEDNVISREITLSSASSACELPDVRDNAYRCTCLGPRASFSVQRGSGWRGIRRSWKCDGCKRLRRDTRIAVTLDAHTRWFRVELLWFSKHHYRTRFQSTISRQRKALDLKAPKWYAVLPYVKFVTRARRARPIAVLTEASMGGIEIPRIELRGLVTVLVDDLDPSLRRPWDPCPGARRTRLVPKKKSGRMRMPVSRNSLAERRAACEAFGVSLHSSDNEDEYLDIPPSLSDDKTRLREFFHAYGLTPRQLALDYDVLGIRPSAEFVDWTTRTVVFPPAPHTLDTEQTHNGHSGHTMDSPQRTVRRGQSEESPTG